jgi:hypothetical protein
VLILPPGHAKATQQLRQLTPRERWLVRVVKAVAALVVVGIVVGVLSQSGPKSSRGCIYATIPGPVGAEQISQCDGQARATCATVFRPGDFTSDAAKTVATECRKAGLIVDR